MIIFPPLALSAYGWIGRWGNGDTHVSMTVPLTARSLIPEILVNAGIAGGKNTHRWHRYVFLFDFVWFCLQKTKNPETFIHGS